MAPIEFDREKLKAVARQSAASNNRRSKAEEARKKKADAAAKKKQAAEARKQERAKRRQDQAAADKFLAELPDLLEQAEKNGWNSVSYTMSEEESEWVGNNAEPKGAAKIIAQACAKVGLKTTVKVVSHDKDYTQWTDYTLVIGK